MSITINNQKGFSRVYQQVWVRRFGLLIQKRRKKSGHSPEKEARWVPATLVQLRSMASTSAVNR